MSEGSSSLYTWQSIWRVALSHRRELIMANVIAVLAAVAAVPVPLLMPLLVDEVLLDQPASIVAGVNQVFPVEWQGPALYIFRYLRSRCCYVLAPYC